MYAGRQGDRSTHPNGKLGTLTLGKKAMSTTVPTTTEHFAATIDELRETGRMFHQRGWSLATSSNYSVILGRDPLHLLITASGKDKGRLTRDDFVQVGADGELLAESPHRSSAETLLHVAIAKHRPAGSVLHTHSVWGTFLSDYFRDQGAVTLDGFEMLKGLAEVGTHQHTERVPIFENTQDIPRLAEQVERWLQSPDAQQAHGFLIHRHGLYTWGEDLAAARRHVETFEFLFECYGRLLTAPPRPS